MRLILMTLFALIAFAANSLLNRWALLDPANGPAAFALVRLVAGAAMLWVLVAAQGALQRPKLKLVPALALATYMLGFSFAYTSLDTGLGALVLFGGVQVTLFAIALFRSEPIGSLQWLGSAMGVAGLAVLFWPSEGAAFNNGFVLMAAAAVGWGVYTYWGRGSRQPLFDTANNFLWAAIPAVGLWLLFLGGLTPTGAALAVLSGAVTSGLGYAVWYAVLPNVPTARAAVLQLSVPILAALMGALVLSEPLTFRFAVAAALVLAGTGLSLVKRA